MTHHTPWPAGRLRAPSGTRRPSDEHASTFPLFRPRQAATLAPQRGPALGNFPPPPPPVRVAAGPRVNEQGSSPMPAGRARVAAWWHQGDDAPVEEDPDLLRSAVEWRDGRLEGIDQTGPPGQLRVLQLTGVAEVVDALRRL